MSYEIGALRLEKFVYGSKSLICKAFSASKFYAIHLLMFPLQHY